MFLRGRRRGWEGLGWRGGPGKGGFSTGTLCHCQVAISEPSEWRQSYVAFKRNFLSEMSLLSQGFIQKALWALWLKLAYRSYGYHCSLIYCNNLFILVLIYSLFCSHVITFNSLQLSHPWFLYVPSLISIMDHSVLNKNLIGASSSTSEQTCKPYKTIRFDW